MFKTQFKIPEKVNINLFQIVVFVLLFMTFHCISYPVLHINTPISILLHLIPLGVMIIYFRLYINELNIIWLLMTIYIVVRSHDLRHGNYIGFFSVILAFLMIIWLQNSNRWFKPLKYMLVFFSVEHIALGWIFLAVKPFYLSHIASRFPAETKVALVKYANQNILMGLANHYSSSGIYCSIALITAFCFFMQNPKSKKNIFFVIIALVSLVFTQKRGPLVFGIMSAALIYFVYKKINIKVIMKFLVIALIMAAAFIIAYQNIEYVQNAFSRFMLNDNDDISNGRIPLYELAIKIFKEHPAFGIGWGGYRYEYSKYKFIGGDTMNAHNIYLQILSELGIVGFSVLYGIMIYSFFKSVKLLRNRKNYYFSELENWIIMFSVGMQALFFLSGLVENVIYYEQMLFPYSMSVAAVYYEMNKIRKSPFIHEKSKIKICC